MVETRSKKRKRQRLILISSNVSSWPDVPARFESLNDDSLTTILEFVGNKSYRSFGGVNYHCREIYLSSGMTKETFLFGYGSLAVIIDRVEEGEQTDSKLHYRVGRGIVFYNRRDVLDWALEERNDDLLSGICNIVAEEGRVDLLDEVWNNVDDEHDKEDVFKGVGSCAARHGKLNVLQWLKTRGLAIRKEICAKIAAEKGHIHILQWLIEEKALELRGELYFKAIYGGHICVMEWLREQGCPWGNSNFRIAALEGNLKVIQWLHDAGCPWPDDHFQHDRYYHVPEGKVKPKVIKWLNTNGYSDKIIPRNWTRRRQGIYLGRR